VRRWLLTFGCCLCLLTILVVSRILILVHPPSPSDVRDHYVWFALEHELSNRKGQTIYEFGARLYKAGFERARGTRRIAEGFEDGGRIEYPPLALHVMFLPRLVADVASPSRSIEADLDRYVKVYRTGMAAIEAILVATLVALLRRLFLQEVGTAQAERLLVYLASTLALWPVLYDRLDLIQAMIVQLAIVLLIARVHYGWSFALLAIAVNLKLVPAILAPVFLVASMPAVTGHNFSFRTARTLGARAIVLVTMVVGLFLPFYLYYGNPCVGFLIFHQNRGIEIGSLYSSMQLALREVGYPIELYYSHYCVNVRSSISNIQLELAPWLMGILLLAATIACWIHFQRVNRDSRSVVASSATLAQLYPREVVSFILLVLLLCVVSNKVFSPQYMLWLVPLVPLVSARPLYRRLFMWTFVLTCLLTTVLFYYRFFIDLAPRLEEGRFGNPSHTGIILLGTRNILVLCLTIGLAIHLWKREPTQPKSAAQQPENLGG
jgi:hypothetical protein